MAKCKECGAASGIVWMTKSNDGREGAIQKAADLWNTRYKRTCHVVIKPSDSDYCDHWHFICSECGCPIEVDEIEQNGDEPPTILNCENYCGTCGAEVIDD